MSLEAKEQFHLSMVVAFAVIDALKTYTDGFTIKWPNDIYWKDKKISGILIENELEGKYITQCIKSNANRIRRGCACRDYNLSRALGAKGH